MGLFDGNLLAAERVFSRCRVPPPPFLPFPMTAAKTPSPLVVKLQILAVFIAPLVLLGLWLQGKGFW
jgi:hypothetical protein